MPIDPSAALEDAGAELLVDELATAGFVEVTNVDDGFTTIDEEEEDTTTTELVGIFLLLEDGTAVALVEILEVETFTPTDDEDDTVTPTPVELAKTELACELFALAIDVGMAELELDFVDTLVVDAGTEGEVVLATATLFDDDVPLTPFGEAGDQNTAGV